MALFEYKFPELGEGIHEGEIVKLLVKAGDTVTDETILMEVQNDKAVVEVPCPVEGKVVALPLKKDKFAHIGELVMTIEVTGELPAESMHHKIDSHAALQWLRLLLLPLQQQLLQLAAAPAAQQLQQQPRQALARAAKCLRRLAYASWQENKASHSQR